MFTVFIHWWVASKSDAAFKLELVHSQTRVWLYLSLPPLIMWVFTDIFPLRALAARTQSKLFPPRRRPFSESLPTSLQRGKDFRPLGAFSKNKSYKQEALTGSEFIKSCKREGQPVTKKGLLFSLLIAGDAISPMSCRVWWDCCERRPVIRRDRNTGVNSLWYWIQGRQRARVTVFWRSTDVTVQSVVSSCSMGVQNQNQTPENKFNTPSWRKGLLK